MGYRAYDFAVQGFGGGFYGAVVVGAVVPGVEIVLFAAGRAVGYMEFVVGALLVVVMVGVVVPGGAIIGRAGVFFVIAAERRGGAIAERAVDRVVHAGGVVGRVSRKGAERRRNFAPRLGGPAFHNERMSSKQRVPLLTR